MKDITLPTSNKLLYKVTCPKARTPQAYLIMPAGIQKPLGEFLIDEVSLKRMCFAIELDFKPALTIDPAFQDEIRNRLLDLLLKLTGNKGVITCATKLLYLLGVARQLDAQIAWNHSAISAGEMQK